MTKIVIMISDDGKWSAQVAIDSKATFLLQGEAREYAPGPDTYYGAFLLAANTLTTAMLRESLKRSGELKADEHFDPSEKILTT